MKEQQKYPEKKRSTLENNLINPGHPLNYLLPNKELKVMIIRMLAELKSRKENTIQ